MKFFNGILHYATQFPPIFYPTFFLSQLNLTYMKQILHLVTVKIVILKSFYNWVKIEILRLVRPRPAIFSPFKVNSTTIYT